MVRLVYVNGMLEKCVYLHKSCWKNVRIGQKYQDLHYLCGMRTGKDEYRRKYKHEKSTMIPKIIHYCWLSKDPFPEDIKACMDSWKKRLPDYEFRRWDLSAFDISSSRWVKQAFYAGKYAFAADYIRLYALYNHGGIYLDCDIEVLKSYNPLLHLPYFIGREQTEYGIEAATIGFEKGHPMLKGLLEYYNDRDFYLGEDKGFDIRPLPSIIREYIDSRYTMKIIDSISDFDPSPSVISIFGELYFSPKKWDTKELTVSSKTYSIHHFSGSWKRKRSLWMKFRFWWFRMFDKKD